MSAFFCLCSCKSGRIGMACTGRMGRMAHRKWQETKQQPDTAGPGSILGCCSVSLRFLCDIHSIHPVVPQGNNFCILSCGGWAMLNNRFAELCMREKSKKRGLLPGLSEFSLMLAQFLLRSASLVFRNKWRRESWGVRHLVYVRKPLGRHTAQNFNRNVTVKYSSFR